MIKRVAAANVDAREQPVRRMRAADDVDRAEGIRELVENRVFCPNLGTFGKIV